MGPEAGVKQGDILDETCQEFNKYQQCVACSEQQHCHCKSALLNRAILLIIGFETPCFCLNLESLEKQVFSFLDTDKTLNQILQM